MSIIVWFRNDLRIHDNETLYQAYLKNQNIIPIFIIPKSFYEKDKLGFDRVSKFRKKFLFESLYDLDLNLKNIGSALLVLKNIDDVNKIIKEYKVKDIYFQKLFTHDELNEENEIISKLSENINFKSFNTSNLIDINDIGNTPDIFTEFRKYVEKNIKVPDCFEITNKIKSEIKESNLSNISDFNIELNLVFNGGESKALKRLNYYLWETDLIKSYKETRNGLLGSDYSSKLSPYLSLGCISPRKIYYELKKYEKLICKNESTYWLFFELLWRDFFYLVSKKYGNKIFNLNGIKEFNRKENNNDIEKFNLWIKGETGKPFIDANMKELNNTGFMSNRGRQNVASYLINDLKVNWTWGAKYFESLLIDYDVCNNWGNWLYLAGVGNDPRENRYFDINKQTKIYDKDSKYIKYWIPELSGLSLQQILNM